MADSLLDNYNPLYDVHLRQYFALPHMQKHLKNMGLLESTLNLNEGDEVIERHRAMMDLMLKNREVQLMKIAELKRKLDAAEKVETCRRIRSGQSPESNGRLKPSRSLSRSRAAHQKRQRRFSNSFDDKEFAQKIEKENAEPIEYDPKDPYKRLSATVKRFNYLHKLDDNTLTAYKENLKKQLQRLERFRELSFGVHSVARQPPPPHTQWFFRRRSILNMKDGPKTPAHQIGDAPPRAALKKTGYARTSCPPTNRKPRDPATKLPPIQKKTPSAPRTAMSNGPPKARQISGDKASPMRGRSTAKKINTSQNRQLPPPSREAFTQLVQQRTITNGTAPAVEHVIEDTIVVPPAEPTPSPDNRTRTQSQASSRPSEAGTYDRAGSPDEHQQQQYEEPAEQHYAHSQQSDHTDDQIHDELPHDEGHYEEQGAEHLEDGESVPDTPEPEHDSHVVERVTTPEVHHEKEQPHDHEYHEHHIDNYELNYDHDQSKNDEVDNELEDEMIVKHEIHNDTAVPTHHETHEIHEMHEEPEEHHEFESHQIEHEQPAHEPEYEEGPDRKISGPDETESDHERNRHEIEAEYEEKDDVHKDEPEEERVHHIPHEAHEEPAVGHHENRVHFENEIADDHNLIKDEEPETVSKEEIVAAAEELQEALHESPHEEHEISHQGQQEEFPEEQPVEYHDEHHIVKREESEDVSKEEIVAAADELRETLEDKVDVEHEVHETYESHYEPEPESQPANEHHEAQHVPVDEYEVTREAESPVKFEHEDHIEHFEHHYEETSPVQPHEAQEQEPATEAAPAEMHEASPIAGSPVQGSDRHSVRSHESFDTHISVTVEKIDKDSPSEGHSPLVAETGEQHDVSDLPASESPVQAELEEHREVIINDPITQVSEKEWDEDGMHIEQKVVDTEFVDEQGFTHHVHKTETYIERADSKEEVSPIEQAHEEHRAPSADSQHAQHDTHASPHPESETHFNHEEPMHHSMTESIYRERNDSGLSNEQPVEEHHDELVAEAEQQHHEMVEEIRQEHPDYDTHISVTMETVERETISSPAHSAHSETSQKEDSVHEQLETEIHQEHVELHEPDADEHHEITESESHQEDVNVINEEEHHPMTMVTEKEWDENGIHVEQKVIDTEFVDEQGFTHHVKTTETFIEKAHEENTHEESGRFSPSAYEENYDEKFHHSEYNDSTSVKSQNNGNDNHEHHSEDQDDAKNNNDDTHSMKSNTFVAEHTGDEESEAENGNQHLATDSSGLKSNGDVQHHEEGEKDNSVTTTVA